MTEHEAPAAEETETEPAETEPETEPEHEHDDHETEEHEADPPAEPETEAPAELPEGAVDMGQIEALEKAQAAYVRRVDKILAPAGVPPECKACNGTGFDFTGGQGEPEFVASPTTEQCQDCAGLGKVLSGSLVPTESVLPCPTCNGAGWRVRLGEHLTPVVPEPETVGPGGRPAWMGDPQLAQNAGGAV